MGVEFVQHTGGDTLSYSCAECETYLTNRRYLVNRQFTASSGRAYLFRKVINIKYSEVEEREMITGLHRVRDVSCQKCDTALGWYYEFAYESTQEYKETNIVLERALICPMNGIAERKK